MFRGMIKNTFKDIANLLKNQNVDEDIIRRWEEYGKEKIVPRLIRVRTFLRVSSISFYLISVSQSFSLCRTLMVQAFSCVKN
jgi:hypothetical protein